MGYTNPFHTEIKVKVFNKLILNKFIFFSNLKFKVEFDVDQLDPRPEYHRVLIEWSNQSDQSPYPSAFSTGIYILNTYLILELNIHIKFRKST